MTDLLVSKGYAPASDVAKKINTHVSTVYRWVDAGEVDGIRVGKRRYVHLESLFSFLGEDAVTALELKDAYPKS
tara:strand:- start:167 stop:388 length:222 start_codon:yes stop_codon:yes gene_type:complete